MTDLERDAIDCNYPVFQDIVKLAQRRYPMSQDLHGFIGDLCDLVGWSKEEMFRRIFRENH